MQTELGMSAIEGALDRTNRGVESTLASLAVSRDEPERLVFLFLNDLTTAAKLFNWRAVLSVAQPLTLPMLLGTVVRAERPVGEKATVATALAGATVAQSGKAATPEKATATSLVGVVAQHGGYGLAIRNAFRASPHGPGTALRGALVAAGAGLAAWKNREILAATAVGGAALVYGTEVADDPQIREGNTHAEGLGHGANLTIVGEALTLVRATLLKGRSGIGARLVEAVGLGLSNLGQMLVVDGIMRR